MSLESNSITEAQSTKIIATLSASSDKDVYVNFGPVSGTALNYEDYNLQFSTKLLQTIIAGGNNSGNSLNQLNDPMDIAIDSDGNIYVVEINNHRVTKWVPGATEGIVVAGGNGSGNASNQLNSPHGITIDSNSNLYISDTYNNRVMKWAPDATEGVLVAGGNDSGSANNQFDRPFGIDIDSSGNLYVVDYLNHRVMKWSPDASEGVIVAGGSQGSDNNQFNYPTDVVLDSDNNLFVTDQNNDRIMKWSTNSTVGEYIVGIYRPSSLVFDANKGMYVTSRYNHSIYKVTNVDNTANIGDSSYSGGLVNLISNGSGSNDNQFNQPAGIFLDENENLYVADLYNHRIKKIQTGLQIKIPAGDLSGEITIEGISDSFDENDKTFIVKPKSATNATLTTTEELNLTITDNDSPSIANFSINAYYILENSSTDIILTAALSKKSGKDISIPFTMSGTATLDSEYIVSASPLVIPAGQSEGKITISTNGLDDTDVEIKETIVLALGTIDNATTTSSEFTFELISDDDPSVSNMSVDVSTIGENNGQSIITTTLNQASSRNTYIPLSTSGTTIEDDYVSSNIGYFLGAGKIGKPNNDYNQSSSGSSVDRLYEPHGIFIDTNKNIFIADHNNDRVVKWTPGSSQGIIVAGGNGTGSNLNQLNKPVDVHVDNNGNIYVLDRNNFRVVKWAPDATEGVIVAGNGKF